MPQTLQLIITGLNQFVDRLNNLENLTVKSEPLMRKISNELYNASNRAFDKKADPETGVQWKDWSPSYYESLVKAVSNKGQGKKGKKSGQANLHEILRKSGELYRQRYRIQEPRLAGLAVKLIYARIHQYGGTITPKKSEYTVKAHHVSEHTRTVRGKTQTVSAHDRKEHTMKACGSRTIPARPFLGLDDHAKKKISYLTEKWLLDLLDD